MNLNNIKEFDGLINDQDVDRLADMAAHVPDNGIILQIGHYRGKSTAALAYGSRESVKIYDIDPGVLAAPEQRKGEESIETLLKYREQVKPWGNRIIQMVAFPADIARIWSAYDAPIDLLFVDCLKHYEGLYPIWESWLPKCKTMVASHNYAQGFEGVERVFEELVKPITRNHALHGHVWSGIIK